MTIEHEDFKELMVRVPIHQMLMGLFCPHDVADMAWMASRPESYLDVTDITDWVLEDAPHLSMVVVGRKLTHAIVYFPDYCLDVAKRMHHSDPEQVGEHPFDEQDGGPDGFFCFGEFMQSHDVEGVDRAVPEMSDWEYQSLDEAATRVVQQRGLSIVMSGDGPYMSVNGGGPTPISVRLGEGAIEKEVEDFRQQMENSSWFGGGEE